MGGGSGYSDKRVTSEETAGSGGWARGDIVRSGNKLITRVLPSEQEIEEKRRRA